MFNLRVWKDGELRSIIGSSRRYSESKHGLHSNKKLWSKSLDYFYNKQWEKAVDSFEKLFEDHPKYYSHCIDNYFYSLSMCINMTLTHYYKSRIPINKLDMTHYLKGKHLEKNNSMFSDQCIIDQRKSTNDKTHYILAKMYYKKWLHTIRRAKKHGISKQHLHINMAYEAYSQFLKAFSPNTSKIFKWILRASKKTLLMTYISNLYYFARVGKLKMALKYMQYTEGHNQFKFDDISFILRGYFHCYILQRLGEYEKSLTVWTTKIESKYRFEYIQMALFPDYFSDIMGIVNNINEQNRSPFVYGAHGDHIQLNNTVILDMKIECFIGLKQFDKAKRVCNFYYDLWGRDDQTVFYDGYLSLCMGNIARAKTLLSFRPNFYRQNQHYFAGLLYYNLKQYDHAKFHFVAAEYYQYSHNIAEHYYYLSKTLIGCQEWILAKYFLNKAFKLTPEIKCSKHDCFKLVALLDDKLRKMKCSNINCVEQNSLRVCKGCGKASYCSRKCQKYDWKIKRHRMVCDKRWLYLFEMMNGQWFPCPYLTHCGNLMERYSAY